MYQDQANHFEFLVSISLYARCVNISFRFQYRMMMVRRLTLTVSWIILLRLATRIAVQAFVVGTMLGTMSNSTALATIVRTLSTTFAELELWTFGVMSKLIILCAQSLDCDSLIASDAEG